jgi:hypothetical protein
MLRVVNIGKPNTWSGPFARAIDILISLPI